MLAFRGAFWDAWPASESSTDSPQPGGGNWVVTSTVAFDRRRMFFRQASGAALATVAITAVGEGQRAAQGSAYSQALQVVPAGAGRRRSVGSSLAHGLAVKIDGRGVPEDLEGLFLQFANQQITLTLAEK